MVIIELAKVARWSHASYIQKPKNAETTILGYEFTLFKCNVVAGTLSMHLVYLHRKFKAKRFFTTLIVIK